ARVREAYGKLPLSFKANAGQTDPRVKFFARGDGYSLFLTSADAMLMLRGSGAQQRASTVAKRTKKSASAMLRMRLVGINPQARINGLDELPGKSNYFKGRAGASWQQDVPTYAKVHYADAYPGIDV